jgi:hypothetical protein
MGVASPYIDIIDIDIDVDIHINIVIVIVIDIDIKVKAFLSTSKTTISPITIHPTHPNGCIMHHHV